MSLIEQHCGLRVQHYSYDGVGLPVETVLDPTRPLIPDLTTIPSESERVQTAQEDERATAREPPRDGPSLPKSSWQAFGESDAPSWKHTGTQESAVSWEPLGPQLLPKTRVRHFVHPKPFGIFPKRLPLPYPDEEILSRYEEDVSSIREGFSAWVETDPETILRRHIVDARGVNPVSAIHQPENTFHPPESINLTMRCPTD